MDAFLKPNRLMGYYVSRELARGKCQTPSYTLSIAADMSDAQWPAPSAEHTAASDMWRANKQASKPGAHQMPFRAWILYRIRSMATADLCDAWRPSADYQIR